MSAQIKDSFFEKYETQYPFLLELPLHGIYTMLHKFYTESYEDSPCKSQILDNSEHSSDIHQVCKVLQKYLPEIRGFLETHKLYDLSKGCEYLNYWIYDKIKHINRSRDNIQSLYNAINILKSSNSLNDKCSNIQDFHISADKFNEKKDLFFHAENLFWIKKKYSEIQHHDSRLYEKYLEVCAEYYKKIMLNNYCKNKEDYKSELTTFSTNFNNTKTFLNVQKKKIELENLKSPETFECTLESKIPEGGPDASHPDDLQNHRGGERDALVSDIGGTGTDPGTIAGTGLGISFFKGYQNFIRPLIEKEKKLFNNLEDEDNEIIEIPDPNQMNLDNTSYHINYHSAQDY
ncbi:PIR protein [Plasmodium ovale]|uniref:PIR protein n=1 Tax=Plasmodium ovale TaxID=36330 RepID=A0A1C3KIV5_PLAOA|nr:PIR protein [Plasmodium ovale]